ncbi:hypothetical protein AAFF_G00258220 [Aldrovandia affinis]|uniref:Uncharacterized protein n=1 Tax=Aldrovandia affinis TaxID=143900 RepID=A0AAD7SUH0_9TELE|nr:hypothetical protein AAFF_G00258220 [Aldrovandia affinis]
MTGFARAPTVRALLPVPLSYEMTWRKTQAQKQLWFVPTSLTLLALQSGKADTLDTLSSSASRSSRTAGPILHSLILSQSLNFRALRCIRTAGRPPPARVHQSEREHERHANSLTCSLISFDINRTPTMPVSP